MMKSFANLSDSENLKNVIGNIESDLIEVLKKYMFNKVLIKNR